MASAPTTISCLALFALSAVAVGSRDHGRDDGKGSVILKVIEMLEDNRNKVARDLASEEKEMAAYAEFCDEESTTKSYAIKDGERKVDEIGAAIEDATAQIEALDASIAGLGSDLAAKEKDLDAAEAERKAEKAEFEANEKVLEASVGQLEKAIAMVKHEGSEAETPEPEAFLQRPRAGSARDFARTLAQTLQPVLDAAWVSHNDAHNLKALLQQQEASEESADDGELSLARQTPKEEGSVVQTLEDMKTKAEESVSAARQEEMKDNFNYQMIKQSLTGALENIKKKLSDAKESKASLQQTVGTSKEELAETKKSLVADKLYLKSLTAECQATAAEWDQRQKDAKGEMAAIEKAKEILSAKVKILAQHDDDFLDGDNTAAGQAVSGTRQRLIKHLKDLGHRLRSYALAELAGAAVADPFAKIRGIIEDMIAKVTAEINEEATHKAFCDDEKTKGEKEKDEKTMRTDELKNRVDTASTKKALLSDQVKELQAEIAKIDSSGAEAAKLRAAEHASYLVASKDFKDGAQAIADAIRVLKDYYASISLLERSAGRTRKEAFGKPQGDAAGVIVGILELSQEDFTKLYMQAETEEKEAADAYKKLVDENTISRASKVAEVAGAESEIKTLEVAVQQTGADYRMSTKELDAVLEYLEKLKPQCEAKAMTYEEKKAKRESEIEGLKEALSILDAPELVQTHKHHS